MNTSPWIKIFACLFMAVDHIGAHLFPDVVWLRLVGRLAFPLFAYGIVQGYFLTHDFEAYAKRLFILAAVWQIFHAFFIYTGDFSSREPLNVIFTLFYSLVCVVLLDTDRSYLLLVCIGFSLLLDCFGIGFVYGTYGVLVSISCYFIIHGKIGLFVIFAFSSILSFASYKLGLYSILQTFAPFAFLLLLVKFPDGPKLNKYFYYLFYPFHLLIIIAIKYYSNTTVILQ